MKNENELREIWKREEDVAHIKGWEFPDFSVDRCFDRLLEVNEAIEKNGYVEGTVHRFLIVAKRV